MTEPDRVLFEAYRPGVPLRPWSLQPENESAIDASLIAQAGGAVDALRHLIAGELPSHDDRLAFGRLNFHAFMKGWEPMVALYDDVPILDPSVGPMLTKHSKHFR
jgi:hypothetical protein